MKALKKRKWTVFFLIKAVDKTTVEYAILMLEQLMRVRFPDEVAVLLCVNLRKADIQAFLNRNLSDVNTDDQEKGFTTLFLKVTTVDGGFRNDITVLSEKVDFDITREEDIKTVLKERILQFFEAKRYLMFTWDHGNGFGIFKGEGKGHKANMKFLITKSENPPEIPILNMRELNNAIALSLGKKKIDLMIMMNCNMQLFDTGYDLYKTTKFVIAPQTQMDFLEYDYEAIFTRLVKDPAISARKLKSSVIKSFKRNEILNGTLNPTLMDVSISVCDLRYTEQATGILNRLADSLLADRARLQQIKDLFDNTRLVDGRFVDLFSVLLSLYNVATVKEQMLINHLFLLKNWMVPQVFVGFSNTPENVGEMDALRGISIVSPSDLSDTTGFLTRTQWGKLMKALNALSCHSVPLQL